MTDEVVVHVEGSEGLERWLESLDRHVDAWLVGLSDDLAGYAGDRIQQHAPGRIRDLVGIDRASRANLGIIEAVAGVHPDLDKELEGVGLGSSPADYPFYVDVGTGIYGEFGTPITSFPGGVMGPIEFRGRMIYASSIKGQPAQDYSGASYRDTTAYLPLRIAGTLGDIFDHRPIPREGSAT